MRQILASTKTATTRSGQPATRGRQPSLARAKEPVASTYQGPAFDFAQLPILPPQPPRSTALPHLDSIQRSFGAEHDLSGVRAQVGGHAATEVQAHNAVALARGEEVRFHSAPSLAIAAHEAAHVIQQRRGGPRDGATQRWEQHADAVAAQVSDGRSAAGLLSMLPRHQPVVQTQFAKGTRHGGAAAATAPQVEPHQGEDEEYVDKDQKVSRERALQQAQNAIFERYRPYLPDYNPTNGKFFIRDELRPRTLSQSQRERVHYQKDEVFDRVLLAAQAAERQKLNPQSAGQPVSQEERARLAVTSGYANKKTGDVFVRSKVDDISSALRFLLIHELLHTLVHWRPEIIAEDLDESATQLLAIGAETKTDVVSASQIQRGELYQKPTELLRFVLEKIFSAARPDDLAGAYLQGDDAKLVDAVNKKLTISDPSGNENQLGWRILVTGFSGEKTWSWSFGDPPVFLDDSLVRKNETPEAVLRGLLDGTTRLERRSKQIGQDTQTRIYVTAAQLAPR